MMLGRPHTEQLDTLVVTDVRTRETEPARNCIYIRLTLTLSLQVFPLPVEGFETRVIADDEQVINYMIELSEALDESRTERLMGWYHSHPFDVDEARNHCFLSNTDMNTQLAWQRAEDPNGNPWLAVVIDPLRSFAKNKPEFGAFRVYPPEYNAPLNETPDGTIVTDDATRIEHWGSCWNRYYQLQVEYFMSTQAKTVIDTLSKNFLWMRTLGSTPALERENRERFAERVGTQVAEKLESFDVQLAHGPGARMGGYLPEASRGGGGGGGGGSAKESDSALVKPTQCACGLAMENLHCQILQVIKKGTFNGMPRTGVCALAPPPPGASAAVVPPPAAP